MFLVKNNQSVSENPIDHGKINPRQYETEMQDFEGGVVDGTPVNLHDNSNMKILESNQSVGSKRQFYTNRKHLEKDFQTIDISNF